MSLGDAMPQSLKDQVAKSKNEVKTSSSNTLESVKNGFIITIFDMVNQLPIEGFRMAQGHNKPRELEKCQLIQSYVIFKRKEVEEILKANSFINQLVDPAQGTCIAVISIRSVKKLIFDESEIWKF